MVAAGLSILAATAGAPAADGWVALTPAVQEGGVTLRVEESISVGPLTEYGFLDVGPDNAIYGESRFSLPLERVLPGVDDSLLSRLSLVGEIDAGSGMQPRFRAGIGGSYAPWQGNTSGFRVMPFSSYGAPQATLYSYQHLGDVDLGGFIDLDRNGCYGEIEVTVRIDPHLRVLAQARGCKGSAGADVVPLLGLRWEP